MKQDETIAFDGYIRWSRNTIKQKNKDWQEVLEELDFWLQRNYLASGVLDNDVEGIPWVCLRRKSDEKSLVMTVCCFPPNHPLMEGILGRRCNTAVFYHGSIDVHRMSFLIFLMTLRRACTVLQLQSIDSSA